MPIVVCFLTKCQIFHIYWRIVWQCQNGGLSHKVWGAHTSSGLSFHKIYILNRLKDCVTVNTVMACHDRHEAQMQWFVTARYKAPYATQWFGLLPNVTNYILNLLRDCMTVTLWRLVATDMRLLTQEDLVCSSMKCHKLYYKSLEWTL